MAIAFGEETGLNATVVSGEADGFTQSTLLDSALVLQFTTNGQTVVQLSSGALIYVLGELHTQIPCHSMLIVGT